MRRKNNEKAKVLKAGVLAALILAMLLAFPISPAFAADTASGNALGFDETLVPTTLFAETEENPYLVRTFFDEEGRQIDEIIVPGRPPEIKAPAVEIPEPDIVRGINVLSDVPAFDWCYGCSATSAAMMFGHYDNAYYTNMYVGPTNGGVCPMTNLVWGSGECPLSATHQGYDGLTVKGHVDDYWYTYLSSIDPYYGNWLEHGYADCTADYMGTNQYYNWQNVDGSTMFCFDTGGAPLYDYSGSEPTYRDGCHGIRLFVESRGYNVYHDGADYQNYNQYIHEEVPGGFTFDDFVSEIDAGRPVIIQVEGHSMLGYGYNTAGSIVYIHDTWDHSDHLMTWGGAYDGLQHYGVTVIQLTPESSLPTVSISTDNFEYFSGDTMIRHLEIDNPTASPVTFNMYLGVPQMAYWGTIASAPIPAGFSYSGDLPFPVGDWGSTPFGMVWYVELTDGTGEVLDSDAATCAYSPCVAVSRTSDAVGAIEESIRKAGQ